MANLNDYLDWRGDVTFDQCPLNELDSSLFSMLVYVNFQGIVPSDPNEPGVTLREAAKDFFFTYDDDEKYPLGLIIPKEIITIFRRMADLPRYANLYLTGYVNEISEEREMQFSAVTIRLPNGDLVASFRGTDDTIIGWKEDFMMAYMEEVPSQRKAAQYLNDLSAEGGLYVTGHSKGGNLSVWAAVHADSRVRDRIIRAYSNDGPGFTREMLQTEAYRGLADRLVFIVPQSSLVGMLFFHENIHEVVKSRARGVFQHNPFTWAVMGAAFVRAEELDSKSVRTETVFRERLATMSADERRQLVELIFDVLESSGAKTLVEFNEGKLRRAFTMVRAISELSKEDKDAAWFLLSKLFDLKISVGEPPAASADDHTKAIRPVTDVGQHSADQPAKPVKSRKRKGRKPTKDSAKTSNIVVEWRWQASHRW